MLYQFGASTGQPRRQSRPDHRTGPTTSRSSRGYMVALNSMTDSLHNSNRVIDDRDGDDDEGAHRRHATARCKFTIGTGCSGGSINSNMNASIAPGQLDGITISCAYPDSETTGDRGRATACCWSRPIRSRQWTALMAGRTAGADQREEGGDQRPSRPDRLPRLVQRVRQQRQGRQLRASAACRTSPPARSPTVADADQQLRAAASAGLRPGHQSRTARAAAPGTGRRRSSGQGCADGIRARDTRDNIGVQYGLKALHVGRDHAEEFVTLNEIVGGIDKRRRPRRRARTRRRPARRWRSPIAPAS